MISSDQRIQAIHCQLRASARKLKAPYRALRAAQLEAEVRYRWFKDSAHRAIVKGNEVLRGTA